MSGLLSQCKTHCLRGPGQTAADQLQHPGHLPLHDTSPAGEGSRAVRDEASTSKTYANTLLRCLLMCLFFTEDCAATRTGNFGEFTFAGDEEDEWNS